VCAGWAEDAAKDFFKERELALALRESICKFPELSGACSRGRTVGHLRAFSQIPITMKKASSSSKAPKSAAPKKATLTKKPEPVARKPKSNGTNGGTEIQANVDVGFGNTVYIRGEGPGINWERGVPMACVKDDLWAFTVPTTARPIVFKFLINDETWCAGDDFVAAPGKKVVLAPSF
jgi:hypothetical protein